MRVQVTRSILDKFDPSRRYQPGETVEFDDERATDLIERGLAVAIDRPGGHADEPGEPGEPGEPDVPPAVETPEAETPEAETPEAETPEEKKPPKPKSGRK